MTVVSRLASVGLVAIAVIVTGLMGCDSTPSPPADASPTVPKQADILSNSAKKQLGKTIPRSIKDRPQKPETKP